MTTCECKKTGIIVLTASIIVETLLAGLWFITNKKTPSIYNSTNEIKEEFDENYETRYKYISFIYSNKNILTASVDIENSAKYNTIYLTTLSQQNIKDLIKWSEEFNIIKELSTSYNYTFIQDNEDVKLLYMLIQYYYQSSPYNTNNKPSEYKHNDLLIIKVPIFDGFSDKEYKLSKYAKDDDYKHFNLPIDDEKIEIILHNTTTTLQLRNFTI